MKKILVIMPRFPYPEAGACEQDRADGLRQLQRLGYSVCVVAKYFSWQDAVAIKAKWKEEGIDVVLVPYKYEKKSRSVKAFLKKIAFILRHPLYLDGAVFDYAEEEMQQTVKNVLEQFQPQLVWFEYTYLWPLYALVKKYNLPIAVRPANFEARHYLEEEGRTWWRYIKAIPKYCTEYITAKKADVLFAISPYEAETYKQIGARRVEVLPLRSLYKKIQTRLPKETKNLHLFFLGSTYSVSHNRKAVEFIIRDLAPHMYSTYGGEFIFHIFGAKLPAELSGNIKNNVIYEGFVEDLNLALQHMDIAVVPSFFGGGMQQKIFEPLTRGFPTITNQRGMGGYTFFDNQEILYADDVASYENALLKLRSLEIRQSISRAAKEKSEKLFSAERLDSLVALSLEELAVRSSS